MSNFRAFGSNCHCHSDASIDGGSSVKKIVIRARELDQGHIVLTEHGNINSAASLAMYCSDPKVGAGLSYSHGIEVYLDPPIPDPDQKKDSRSYVHLTVLFKDTAAYEYFCKLTPIMEERAIIRWGERKPIILWSELEEIGPHIVLGSGCLVGMIQKFALNGHFDLAEKAYQMCRSIVQPGCFFVEVFPHCITHEWKRPTKDSTGKITEPGRFVENECLPGQTHNDIQRIPNEFVVAMARKYGDRIIVSEDSHFAYPNQKSVQDCVEIGTLIFSSKGLLPIEDLHVGDKVLTHLGNWKPILATRGGISKKNKTKITFNGGVNSIVTTSDHLFYVPILQMKDDKSVTPRVVKNVTIGYTWKKASDLTINDFVMLPKVKLPDSNETYIADFTQYLSKSKCINNLHAAQPALISDSYITESFAYVAGLFVGDGHASPTGNWSIYVNDWNVYGQAQVIQFFADINVTYRTAYYADTKLHHYYCNSSQLRRWFYDKFYREKNKHIDNEFFFALSDAYKSQFIRGLYDADGRSKGDSISIVLKSQQPISILAQWALSKNAPFTVTTRAKKRVNINGIFKTTKETYALYFRNVGASIVNDELRLKKNLANYTSTRFFRIEDNYICRKISQIDQLLPDFTPVYDLEVEDDNSFTSQFAILHNCKLGQGMEAWKFSNSYHMRTSAESFEGLKVQGYTERDMEEFIDNSYALKDKLKDYKFLSAKDRWVLPLGDVNNKKKLIELINRHGRMPKNDQVYVDRLRYEVSVFGDSGIADFLPYIFQVEDVSSWAKENGVLMNLRGSGGGSLLYYLIGASITDPIKYNLPFERHLTLGRIRSGALPDADADFSDKQRVMNYLYGSLGDRIAPISINIGLKVKNSIRDAERTIYGKVNKETEIMCARFPGIPQGVSETGWLFGYKDEETGDLVPGFFESSDVLKKYAEDNALVWEMVLECLGVMRNKGTHACGFIITPKPVHHYFPLTFVGKTATGQLCTGFDPKSQEWAGGIKFDFLGVKTLKVIEHATKLIKQRHNVDIPWEEYPHDDNVYKEIFHTGNTIGVFQFNTPSVRPFLSKIKPTSTKDLSAITALVRPGSLDAPAPDGSNSKSAEYYVKVASGQKPYYIHPDMEEILSETNGVILYQEQLLYTFTSLGGYTLEKAEEVRRAISKKDKVTLEFHINALKTALIGRGWKREQTNILCSQLLASNRYSFNKAHAMSYAIVGYNTAYLKYHYPLEFWTAELTAFADNADKFDLYTQEIGDLIMLPSISNSHPTDWVINGDKICAPLSILKGLGDATTEAIVTNAPYSSIEDFAARCPGRKVNKSTFMKLVYGGVFDEYNIPHKEMLQRYWLAKKIKEPIPDVEADPLAFFMMQTSVNKLNPTRLHHFLGEKLYEKFDDVTPMNRKLTPYKIERSLLISDSKAGVKLADAQYQEPVYMFAIFNSSRIFTTKGGKQMLKIDITDGFHSIEAVNWKSLVTLKYAKGTTVLVKGFVKKGFSTPLSITILSIEPV